MSAQDDANFIRQSPGHDKFRQALRWISLRREERPTARTYELVSEACRQFDLSPKDEQSLLELLAEGSEQDQSQRP